MHCVLFRASFDAIVVKIQMQEFYDLDWNWWLQAIPLTFI